MPKMAMYVAALLCLLSAPPPDRPGTPQNEPPSYHATTRLVELTVVAMDRNGNPVTDLKKDDFAVFDNGKPREISFFRYEGRVGNEKKAPAPQPHVFSNREELNPEPQRNVVALMLDSLNTEPRDQMLVKAQTIRLLRALAPQTRVAIYQLGREFRVLHDYTDDMASLRAQLERFKVEFPAQKLTDIEQEARAAQELLEQIESAKSPYRIAAAAPIEARTRTTLSGEVNFNTVVRGNRVDATLGSLQLLGRHLSAVPGRKSVVWISGGIAIFSAQMSTNSNQRFVNPAAGEEFRQAIRKASEHLAQSGVSLYAVDARGLLSSAETLSERQYPALPATRFGELERADAQGADARGAFSLMASVTGGRFIFNTNDFSDGIRKVTDDLRGSYSIGFYATEEPDGKWHTLKATASRPDVRLLHKEGYVSEGAPAAPQAWGLEQARQAMMSPLVSSAIRLTAHCQPAGGAEPGTVLLTLQIESEDLTWHDHEGQKSSEMDVYVGEETPEGKLRFQQATLKANVLPEQWPKAQAEGLPYRREWKPGADTLAIRILVRDTASGRVGTLDLPMAQIASGGGAKPTP